MVKPAFDQAAGQRIPGTRRLVGEHDGHDAVGLQHAALFLEYRSHAALVVTTGEVLCAAFLSGELAGLATASRSLSVRWAVNSSG